MALRGMALSLAAAVVVGACGGVARPEGRSLAPEPAVSGSSTTSAVTMPATSMASTITTAGSPSTSTPMEPDESSPSTTTTTLAGDGLASTTASPTGSIDIGAVQQALDALDAVFEGLDGHIGSIELDEGEAP